MQDEPPILFSDTRPFVHHLELRLAMTRIKRAALASTVMTTTAIGLEWTDA
jgi:hypothetical protein